MKTLRYTLIPFLSLLMTAGLFSQQTYLMPTTAGPDGFVRCASVEVNAVKKANNPSILSEEKFEEWLAPLVREYKESSTQENGTILTIPCVIHILHNGEAYGAAPNIVDAQAISQVQVLNEDFRRIFGTNGYNTHPDGADVEVEFVLAQTDPLGNPTNGINRVNIQQDGATVDDLENVIKPMTIWDPTKYMNMWTVKFAAPDDNLLGYAQFPEGSGLAGMPTGTENAMTDGVVQTFDAFGTINADSAGTFIMKSSYALGRTATHEVGHWLGLRHIWGDGLGCNLPAAPPGCSCLQDDYCEDTPNSEKANYDCSGLEMSVCDGIPSNDMTANYMDYSNDACMNIFTNDQKARVQAVLANSPRRKELVGSNTNELPVPYVNFAVTSSQVVEGSSCNTKTFDISVQLSEPASENATVSFSINGTATQGIGNDFTLTPSVTFPKGTSTPQLLTITILEDGEVEADEFIEITIDTVITTGDAVKGLFNTQHIATISDDDFPPELAGGTPHVLVFTEQFNTLGLSWTETASPGSNVNWSTGTPPLGMIGNYSAYIARTALPGGTYTYDHTVASTVRFESPVIDASNFSKLSLSFDYICFGEEGYDFGSLYYTTDGTNWTQFGPALNNAPVQTSMTIPLPADADQSSTLQIGFQWDNDELLGIDPPLSFDNIELRGSQNAPIGILSDVNTGNLFEAYIGPFGSANFYDDATGKVMMTLTNNSDVDLGCTTVEVDRSSNSAGANTVNFWNNNAENALAAKTFYISTEHGGGDLNVTLYYKDSEITSWENATGNSRDDLEVVQVKENSIGLVSSSNNNFDIVVEAATLSPYQNDVRVSANFDGDDAGFGIGIPGTPASAAAFGNSSFEFTQNEIIENQLIVALFPNPVSDEVTMKFNTKMDNEIQLQIQNHTGQVVFTQDRLNSNKFNFNTNDLPNGVYVVLVKSGNEVETKKLVVQH